MTWALRHPLHRAPAFWRGPDAAFEPETVDRHGRAERADAAEPDAGPLEAALLPPAARSRVGAADGGLRRLVLKVGERVVDQRAPRLGGVAFAPILGAQPV